MPQIAEVIKKLQNLNEANYKTAVEFIYFLSDAQEKETSPEKKIRRSGLGKGIIKSPEDLDQYNDEIAELFGVV